MLPLLYTLLAGVRRPARGSFSLSFDGLADGVCQFTDGAPLTNEYAAANALFSGPGYGELNGGAVLGGCALSGGAFPPLGNQSFSGGGFLGFSTLHVFNAAAAGKPIAPETVRFAVRMTNVVASFAGIDGHTVTVTLWSGPSNSYNDAGSLLKTVTLPMTSSLQALELVDENDIFVDCVRRIEISSAAKMFVLDDLRYDLSAADDSVCSDDPAIAEAAAAEEAARLEEQQKSSAPRRGRAPQVAAATAEWAGVCTAALTCWLLRRHGASRRGWHFF